MKYKFGICEWSLPVGGTMAIEIAGKLGYDAIQLGEAGGRQSGYPLNNKEVQSMYLKAAEGAGIELHSLNLGALLSEGNLNYAADTRRGQQARKSLENGFDACKALGIHRVVITVNSEGAEQTANVLSHLAYASKLAAQTDVVITMESAQPLAEIQEILRAAGEQVKICMDILNPIRFGTGEPCSQIQAFGAERIDHYHMKDSVKDLFHLGERGCVLLGTGDGVYEDAVSLIKNYDRECYIITENYYYLPPMNDGSADFIKMAGRDLETMRKSFQ